MYEHVGHWNYTETEDVSMRLDFWDTGRTDSMGKTQLRYALWINLDSLATGKSAMFEGEDFGASPLHAIDSDATAAALLSFFAHDADAIAMGHGGELSAAYTVRQWNVLARVDDELSMWSYALDPQ